MACLSVYRLPVCLSVCLPIYLHAHLLVSLSACLPVSLHACLSVSLPACLPVSLPACLLVSLPACLHDCQSTACLSAWLSVYRLPVCMTVCLSVCLPICMPVPYIRHALHLLKNYVAQPPEVQHAHTDLFVGPFFLFYSKSFLNNIFTTVSTSAHSTLLTRHRGYLPINKIKRLEDYKNLISEMHLT